MIEMRASPGTARRWSKVESLALVPMNGAGRHDGSNQDQCPRQIQRHVKSRTEHVIGGIDHLGGNLGHRCIARVLGLPCRSTTRSASGLDRVFHQALKGRRDADRLETSGQVTCELAVDDGAQNGHAEDRAHLPTGVGG